MRIDINVIAGKSSINDDIDYHEKRHSELFVYLETVGKAKING